MTTTEDIDLITHVGPGTPMGEMLRRYWVPAMLADELPEADGTPKALRLLGEDLVAFRDTQGRVGIMDVHCPHRLSSLALGRNEEGGLRCLYHGWKIDVEGKILETPCELPTSRLRDHITHTAYPVREAADLIWVYMGPADKVPDLPDFNWMAVPATHRSIGKLWEECNFIQAMEGIFDTYHTNLLHSGFEVLHWTPEQIAEVWKRPSRSAHGTIGYEETGYGYRYAAIREPTVDSANLDYIRITEFVAPFYCMNPPDLGRSSRPFIFVPIDDHNTTLFEVLASEDGVESYSRSTGTVSTGRFQRGPTGEIDHDAHLARSKMRPGVDLYDDYRPVNNAANQYGQDRDLMQRRDSWASYSGILSGAQPQDLAMIETMGAISDRTKEHLGASDLGIIHWRERLIAAVRDFAAGEEPIGIDPPAPYREIRAVGALVPKGDDWNTVKWDAEVAATPAI